MAREGLSPTILWAQRNDTIFLTVSLIDIKNEKVSLEDNLFTFSGEAGVEKRAYAVTLRFLKEVIPQESKHKKTDRGLFFVIKKKESGPYWPRLLEDSKKPPFLKTDFGRWKDEDESDSDTENPYNDESLNAMMQQMGGGGMMGGMGGMGGKPSLDDLEDESDDSDDEPLPELES